MSEAIHTYDIPEKVKSLLLETILYMVGEKGDEMPGHIISDMVSLTEDVEISKDDQVTVTSDASHRALAALMAMIAQAASEQMEATND